MRSILISILCAIAATLTGVVGALAVDAPPQAAAAAAIPANHHLGTAAADTSDLGPTSLPPWNPAQAMPPRRAWERAVLLPGRVLSLPLAGLGFVTQAVMLRAEDGGMIPLTPRARSARPSGPVALRLPELGDETGLGAAVELQSPSWARLPRVKARYAATFLDYNSTRLGASLGPASLEYGYDWRPQDAFYGRGTSTSQDSLANFGAQDEFARGVLHWSARPDSGAGRSRLSFRAWGGPRSLVTRTGRNSKEVSYEARFPALGSATLDRRVEHLVYGGSVTTDWRAGRPHWSHGGRLMLGVERYDMPIRALALQSSHFEGAQFTRYSAEAEGGVSFTRDPRTIRLLLRLTDQRVEADRDRFLLSDLSRLGGRDGLAGFSPGRFHDLDLLHAKLSYVFPLARLFESEIHSEWGAVYPDVWRDAKFGTLKHSFGLSVRARSDAAPFGALGFDVSPEGVRVHYAVGGVE